MDFAFLPDKSIRPGLNEETNTIAMLEAQVVGEMFLVNTPRIIKTGDQLGRADWALVKNSTFSVDRAAHSACA